MTTASVLHRVVNFSAGPSTLPRPVLEQAREDLLDYQGTGMSVMEMSHRSPAYEAIHTGTLERLRRLLALPEEFALLLLPGGASLQFTMVPMNLMPPVLRADHVITGSWSKKALAEATKHGVARVAASTEEERFRRLPRPEEIDFDPAASYAHLTTNNTIYGTQWTELPPAPAPLALDMSSDVLARPVDWSRVGVAYAGAQKNLGPAGVTLVAVRQDLMERAPRELPAMLDYRVHAHKGSLYNTPPCWTIYVTGLVAAWVEEEGGVAAMQRRARERAALLYARLDREGLYRGTVEPDSRSSMNVTFRLADEALEPRFLAAAHEAGLVNLKGHRSVGGVRASLYNAMTREGVEALAAFMDEFERRHA